MVANNEKLNGITALSQIWPPWPPSISCLGQPFSATTGIYQKRDTVIAFEFFK